MYVLYNNMTLTVLDDADLNVASDEEDSELEMQSDELVVIYLSLFLIIVILPIVI